MIVRRLPASLIGFLRHVPIPRVDPFTVRAANFAIRTTIASLLALYAAFYLQLEEPHWAAVTVWVVGQPMRGMALNKSFYRFFGTLAGAIMAIALTALFAQTPTLFLLTFASWIAFCTYISTLLRNFRAYGTVLAGYTCGIIALAAYGIPNEVFDIAVSRVSCIGLGIAFEALVAAVFVKSTPQPALLMRLRTICSDAAAFASAAIGDARNVGNDRAQRILRDIVSLDAAVSYAAAEDQNIRRQAGALRQIIISIMTAVSAAQALGRHVSHSAAVPETLHIRMQRTGETLRRVTPENSAAATEETEALYEEMQQADWKRVASGVSDPDTYFTGSRFADMLRALSTALRQTEDFFAGRPMKGTAELSLHRDFSAARINALRAFVAVICAGAFWTFSGWSHGQDFTRIVAVVCALYATRDNPVIGSRNFFNGALVAGAAAAFCHMFILSGINGYPLLVMLLAPFMIAGGFLMVRPKTVGIATAFNIYFISLLGLSNDTRLPFISFLNDLIPLIFGVGISVIVFMVFFPINLEKRRLNIQRATMRDIASLALSSSRMSEARWCSRMADRLSLLSAIRPPGNENPLIERTLAAVEIGVQTIRLREIQRNRQIPDAGLALVSDMLQMISRLFHLVSSANPDHRTIDSMHARIGQANARLTEIYTESSDLPPEQRMSLLQAISAQREITEILALHYIEHDNGITGSPAAESQP